MTLDLFRTLGELYGWPEVSDQYIWLDIVERAYRDQTITTDECERLYSLVIQWPSSLSTFLNRKGNVCT